MANKEKLITIESNKCVICESDAHITCTNCNLVQYCSKNHQKEHLKKHKNQCKPFVIESDDIFGRFIMASRDIKQGELIFKESPIVVGPSINLSPTCLNCYKPIPFSNNPFTCLKCGVAPICSPLCKSNGHTVAECETFKTNPNLSSSILIQHFQIIMPLRCLILREHSPKVWEDMMTMEAHMDKRRNTPIWRNHKFNVESVISNCELLKEDDIKNELIQKICGILDVNSFELRVPGFEMRANLTDCLRGLYLEAALMAHDCTGNTHLAVDDNFNIIVHASIPIRKGTPLYFNYTNTLHNTYERLEHLKEGKYFNCSCPRCYDPTEFGTYMSSLLCVKCHKGIITPKQSCNNINNTTWQCSTNNCTHLFKGRMIGSALNCAKDLIDGLDRSDIREVEMLLKKLLRSLSPVHSIIIDLKQCLIGLYSEILRREPNPNRKILNRKIELCKEFLPILEKVEPGISRFTGLTLYELHIPLVVLANRKYENGEISAENLLEQLLEGEEFLKKGISHLLYEPNNSPEGRLNLKAMNELKLLRGSISNVKQIVANKQKDKRRKKQVK